MPLDSWTPARRSHCNVRNNWAALLILGGALCIGMSAEGQGISGSYSFSGTTTSATGPNAADVPSTWSGQEDLSQPEGQVTFTGTGTLNGQPITESGQIVGTNVQFVINGFMVAGMQTTIFCQGTLSASGDLDGTFFGGTSDAQTFWSGTWHKGGLDGGSCEPIVSIDNCVCKLVDRTFAVRHRGEARVVITMTEGPPGPHPWEVSLDSTQFVSISGIVGAASVSGTIECGQTIVVPLIATNTTDAGDTTVVVTVAGVSTVEVVRTFRIFPGIEILTVAATQSVSQPHKSNVTISGAQQEEPYAVTSEKASVTSTAVAIGNQQAQVQTAVQHTFNLTVIGFNHEGCATHTHVSISFSEGTNFVHQQAVVTDSEAIHRGDLVSAVFGDDAGQLRFPEGGVLRATPPQRSVGSAAEPISVIATKTKQDVFEINVAHTSMFTLREIAKTSRGLCESQGNGAVVRLGLIPECP